MRTRSADEGDGKPQWLLMKKNDDDADADRDIVAEVEGVLVYADGPRRLELHPEGAGTPSIRVYFLLGDRTLFGATAPRLPPSYYDQVSEFVGKRVRIVGMTAPGQVRADIGHIVLADAQPPRVR